MYAPSAAYVEAYFPVSLPATEYSGYNTSFTAPFADLSTTQWFTDPGTNTVGLQVCTEGCGYSQQYAFVSGGSPQGIVASPTNGLLYVADAGNNAIVAFAPGTCGGGCSFTSYPIPTASSSPEFLAIGADGNIWFTEYATNKIGVLKSTPPYTISELTLPTANAGPWAIALGPDGNIWFTEKTAGKIGVVMP